MCLPALALTPGLMTGLQIASSAFGLVSQMRTQSAQEEANRRNYENQMQAYRFNQANANFQKVQESENLAAKKVDINADVARKQATARVAAAEGGVDGLSVDALLAEIAGSGGRAITNAETNYLRTDRAIEADKMNSWSSAATNIGNLKTPEAPNYLGTGLKIATAVDNYKRGQ